VTVLAATQPSPLWYLTRGSGVVALLLLTATVILGVLSSVRWRSEKLPRFVVSGLHRNLTLLAVAFLGVHVATAVADTYAPIGVKDVFAPFVSTYRPLWLGLGTLGVDLLAAVVVTSLLRVRLGYRTWRVTHWLAYASWPVALLHSLGTGSDARFGWLAALAFGSVALVALAVLVRLARTPGDLLVRGAVGAVAVALPLAGYVWYRSGPAQHGWARRAGTPASLLKSTRAATRSPRVVRLPQAFDAQLLGTLTQVGPNDGGLVTIRIDGSVAGRVRGELRVALQGYPTEGGGVTMTSSGVAFAAKGTPVFEGSIVALAGNEVSMRLSAPSEGTVQLDLVLQLNPSSNSVTGSVHGVRV
jgi:hypothetical protein